MRWTVNGFISVLMLLSASVTNTTWAQAPREDTSDLTMKGRKLSSQDADDLEAKLKANPNDLSIRAILLGYYFGKDERPIIETRQNHILWVIENHPESELAGRPECEVNQFLNQEHFSQAKKTWLNQLELHKNEVTVVGNAANFFFLADKELAESLLKQAEIMDPNNPEWPEQLGFLYSLELENTFGKTRGEAASRSLEKYERALSLADNEFNEAGLLGSVANASFEAGKLVRAKAIASHLLDKYGHDKDSVPYDDAVFEGNQVLGRVALREGNIARAKRHLLASARISGSPVLSSFGPDMTLAKELLEKGQKTVVLEYLHLCATFWNKAARLKDWEDDIGKGRMPDFGRLFDQKY